MKVADFDYTYPAELVANHPLDRREDSRLMLVSRQTQTWQHQFFKDISNHFREGDVLVLNNTKVFPCRLFSKKTTGGKVEVFLLSPQTSSHNEDETGRSKFNDILSPALWSCLVTDSKKLPSETRLDFGDNFFGLLKGEGGATTRNIELHFKRPLMDLLQEYGHVPIPRYIKREDDVQDKQRYQTVFAKEIGSVAAPTAGLHFSENILTQLKERGVIITEVTLHVGIGTFLPVKTESVHEHQMHEEFFSLSQDTADIINRAKAEKRRITAVGTTVTRALESSATTGEQNHRVVAKSGGTKIFIYPPYQFKIIDRLITNFHQPQSTLLMLVCALAGYDLIKSAYQEALLQKYRLFSYGDAMLIE